MVGGVPTSVSFLTCTWDNRLTMNIGQTGLYFDEWWFLFLTAATCAYFALLLHLHRRNRKNLPRRRSLIYFAMFVVTLVVLFGLVIAFHDLAFAGQNYEREAEISCLSNPPPRSNVRRVILLCSDTADD